MAINNYTGLMGSGKSYEVVSTVILDAVASGRRVVTNIDGIQPDLIYDYLVEKRKIAPDKLGTIKAVKNDDVTLDNFFPDEEKPDETTIVQPGDLVAIDEVWRFWGTDVKLSPNAMQFFRMHRHYTDKDTGLSCDIALMIQDTSSLHRKIREVVEMTTRTVKLKAVGMPKQYRIEIYEGNKVSKQTHIDTYVKKYNADIFPLYKSYGGTNGTEKPMDKRQNIFNNKKIYIAAILVVVMCLFAARQMQKFFNPTPKTDNLLKTTPLGPPGTATAPTEVKPATQASSTDWRITGRLITNGALWFVLQNEKGRIRYESNDKFTVTGPVITGQVDGQTVNLFAGGSSAFTALDKKQ